MKFLTPQVMAILQQRDMRRNLRALLRQLGILVIFIAIYSVGFHMIMEWENQNQDQGQHYSWITGVYWTLTVMSTLGFGDITFHTDVGRLFSLLVLITGVTLLLIVLPFSFIRYFYAPWIEAQIRFKAPRSVPGSTRGHVVLCNHDAVAQAFIGRLTAIGVDYVVIEPDPDKALNLHSDGVKVVMGELDVHETWRRVHADQASLVVANLSDAVNTAVTLILREQAPEVPIAAIVDDVDALDILELSGADHAIPLKRQLGEHLAAHAGTGAVRAHHIGSIGSLVIAEFAVRRTDLAGSTIRESGLRAATGLNVVAVRHRGRLHPAVPERVLGDDDVLMVVGTEDQLPGLDEVFVNTETSAAPVLLIGGGRVGFAAARALKGQDVGVHVVEQDPALGASLTEVADQVVIGNAASLEIMKQAGIEHTPSVLLTTHDDATNIFLTIYARRLNPSCHIVSRVTHERNLDAIHRAGANFVLSESSLGAKLLLGVQQQREPVVIGEDVDVFITPMPSDFVGISLADSHLRESTGLLVIGTQSGDTTLGAPPSNEPLTAGTNLVLLGTRAQHDAFRRRYRT